MYIFRSVCVYIYIHIIKRKIWEASPCTLISEHIKLLTLRDIPGPFKAYQV